MREPKAKELTLILIGQFNPVIISPQWLAGKELISDLDAKEALEMESYISHPEISQFKLDFCAIQTIQNKFTISSTQEGYFDRIQEITSGIFTYLNETPVLQLGINTIYHYEFSTRDEMIEFGNILSPKTIWDSVVDTPIMKKLDIISKRPDEKMGEFNTSVELSPFFSNGIRIAVNDHNVFYTEEEYHKGRDINAKRAVAFLENWKSSLEIATSIIEGVMNYEAR